MKDLRVIIKEEASCTYKPATSALGQFLQSNAAQLLTILLMIAFWEPVVLSPSAHAALLYEGNTTCHKRVQ